MGLGVAFQAVVPYWAVYDGRCPSLLWVSPLGWRVLTVWFENLGLRVGLGWLVNTKEEGYMFFT